jgi:hypothetical protein
MFKDVDIVLVHLDLGMPQYPETYFVIPADRFILLYEKSQKSQTERPRRIQLYIPLGPKRKPAGQRAGIKTWDFENAWDWLRTPSTS